REDEPEPVVGDATLVARPGLRRRRREHRGLPELGGARLLTAEPVESTVACGGGEPGAGDARDAVPGPAFQRPGEGILRALLGEVPVARDPDQGRDHATPGLPERTGDRDLHRIGQLHLPVLESIPLRRRALRARLHYISPFFSRFRFALPPPRARPPTPP